MKKLIIVFFSFCTLNACQTSPLDSKGVDESAGLSTQYSDHNSTNKAADLNTQLGAGYIGNGRYDRALVKLNKAIKQDPDYALAHNYLGVLYSRLERPEQAHMQFKKSIKLSPYDSSLLNNYAIFQCEQKNFAEAKALFTKVINNPLYINRAAAYQSAGWCALENNNIDLAEKMYRKAIGMDATMPGAILGLAKINYKKKNYKYAWSYFQRYDKRTIPNADGLWLGINILNKLDKPDRNLLSSYELKLKSKFPDTDETKWLYEGKQDY